MAPSPSAQPACPIILGGLSGLPGARAPGLSASGEAGDIPAGMGGELAALQRAVGDLKALEETRPVNVEGLSAAEREIMQEAAPRLKFRSNTLTRSAGLAPGGRAFPGTPCKIISLLEQDRDDSVRADSRLLHFGRLAGRWGFFKDLLSSASSLKS